MSSPRDELPPRTPRRRIDGRVVIAGMVVVFGVFILLNVLLAGGSEGVRELAHPTSSPAERGVSYPVHLLSRCVPALDFDGAYWAAPGTTLRGSIDPATATLVSDRLAVLELAGGRRIGLERFGSTIRLAACPTPSP